MSTISPTPPSSLLPAEAQILWPPTPEPHTSVFVKLAIPGVPQYVFYEFLAQFTHPRGVFFQSALFFKFSLNASHTSLLFGKKVLATVPLMHGTQPPPTGTITHAGDGVSLVRFRDDAPELAGCRRATVDFKREIRWLGENDRHDGPVTKTRFLIKLDLRSMAGEKEEDGGGDRLDAGDLWAIHLVVEETNEGMDDHHISKIISATVVREGKAGAN